VASPQQKQEMLAEAIIVPLVQVLVQVLPL
jgi:hypothetical protein